MSSNKDIELNAYVDGELSDDDRIEILSIMRSNPEIAKTACELTNLKSQLQLAYAAPPGIGAKGVKLTRRHCNAIAAGAVMLATGLIGGWFVGNSPSPGDRFVMLDSNGYGQAPAYSKNAETRIVFHLTTPDQTEVSELLFDIEEMLVEHRKKGSPLRVEIVSHGEGLDLLRTKLSKHRATINKLASQFDNLTFVACKNTIERVEVSEGIEITVLPSVKIIDSGVTHVVKRQKEGWTYIRV